MKNVYCPCLRCAHTSRTLPESTTPLAHLQCLVLPISLFPAYCDQRSAPRMKRHRVVAPTEKPSHADP
jgi:hypothetical protein